MQKIVEGTVERTEPIELCSEYCPEDCIYRSYIGSGSIPICYYAVIVGESRKCKISECDKYVAGEKTKPTLNTEYIIEWEYGLYDDDNTSR